MIKIYLTLIYTALITHQTLAGAIESEDVAFVEATGPEQVQPDNKTPITGKIIFKGWKFGSNYLNLFT